MNQITDLYDRAVAQLLGEKAEQRIVSMSPHGIPGASVGAVLRARIEALAQAIRDKNVDQLMTFYAHDVEVFDVRGSLNVTGAGAYRENFQGWFDSFEGPLGFELHDLRIVPGQNTGYCHYLALVTGARSTTRISGYWVRGTTCFERRDGEWLVSHEHISMPS
jgi:ketosteroid isomerase-like protein